MLPPELIEAAESLSRELRARSQTLTTVESCTGGLVGAAITALPGSSDIYPGGYITYSNELKQRMVGVSANILKTHGAVSAQTAIEMAMGGLGHTNADHAIAITGIAGPNGGSDEKPVGTVWICVCGPERKTDCRRFLFPGERPSVRESSAISAMRMLIQMLKGNREALAHEEARYDGSDA